MRKLHPLATAATAFVLGGLATASLTGVAHANGEQSEGRPRTMYHVVTDERTMNKYAAEGYEVKQANATNTDVYYLMQRYR